MRVTDFMDPKGILLHANIHTMQYTVGILVELQEGLGGITNGTACYNAACKRETMGGTTAIGQGIALPHTANAGVCAPGVSAVVLRRGVDWGAPDEMPVDLVFMVAIPPHNESLHLQILARLVNLLQKKSLTEALRSASNPERFLELLKRAEADCFAE